MFNSVWHTVGVLLALSGAICLLRGFEKSNIAPLINTLFLALLSDDSSFVCLYKMCIIIFHIVPAWYEFTFRETWYMLFLSCSVIPLVAWGKTMTKCYLFMVKLRGLALLAWAGSWLHNYSFPVT